MKPLGCCLAFTLVLASVLRAQTPVPAGAILWLKSDTGVTLTGTTVSEWKDQSGSTKSAYQTLPTSEPIFEDDQINHKPVIHFDGKYTFFNCAPIFPVGKDYTLTMVIRLNDFSRTNHVLSGNSHQFYLPGTAAPVVRNDTSGGTLTSSISLVPKEAAIVTVIFNQASGIASIYFNGSLADSGMIGPNSDPHIYFGAYQGVPSFLGDIAEVILYPERLTLAGRRQLESYLFRKYALQPQPAPDSIYTAIPNHLQFYARGDDDSATVNIAGNYPEPGYDSMYLNVIKSGQIIQRFSSPLTYQHGTASFSFAPRIHAELSEYSFYLGAKSEADDRRVAFRDSIVAGDVLLIDGQSNAINNNLAYTNEFYRTFGSNQSSNSSDTLWAIPDTIVRFGPGPESGSWGIRLQELLRNTYHIPSCVINGAVGGTPIELHLRDPLNPTNLLTIYGSMLYRAQKADVASKAKVLFWYQGESNIITGYAANFDSLYHQWKQDYPNLRKIYVMQVRPGCSQGFSADVRELLRNLPQTYTDIEAVSTMGLPGHDGCHFLPIGYSELGDQLFRLLARDFYGSTDRDQISSPNIIQAYYTTSSRTEIGLTFSPADTKFILPADTIIGNHDENIKDYFYFDDAFGTVQSISAVKNRLFLALKQPSQAKNISYLPDKYYNDTAVIYEGPWITNTRGIGAFSFFHVPIVDSAMADIAPESGNFQMNIYPNPSSGKILLHYELPKTESITVSLTNVLGEKIIQENKGELVKGQYDEILDMHGMNIPNGIYFCRIQAGAVIKALTVIVR